MNAPNDARFMHFALKDSKLFRQQCRIEGAWLDADDKATMTVTNRAPNPGKFVDSQAHVPRLAGCVEILALKGFDARLCYPFEDLCVTPQPFRGYQNLTGEQLGGLSFTPPFGYAHDRRDDLFAGHIADILVAQGWLDEAIQTILNMAGAAFSGDVRLEKRFAASATVG